MLKLFTNITFRIIFNMAMVIGGFWFYFILQEPSTMNQVFFLVFFISLFITLAIDMIEVLNRFISTPTR